MQALNLVSIHIWCGEDLLGVSQVKCESRMGELFNLLSSVNSPYEFLTNCLGMATLHDADEHLAAMFRKNMPKSGFTLLQPDINYEREKSKEEFPTLLHFASRHGLCQLVRELLQCPGSQIACSLKNIHGFVPTQLANRAGHNNVTAVIEEYPIMKTLNAHNVTCSDTSDISSQVTSEPEKRPCNPSDDYDIPSYPIPVLHTAPPSPPPIEKECEYLKMEGFQKENIEPLKNILSDTEEKKDLLNGIFNTSNANKCFKRECSQHDKSKLSLLESQTKLIEIMEAYKKGASLTEVERLHNEWKALYQVSDIEAKSTLEGLRNLYAKAQKAKLSKKHSSSFSELRQFLNSKLRRKDSMGSKCSLTRKLSKDMTSLERLTAESDVNRPVSTLSVLSNTSSSSGSSFDRLSTASAGSDSGHHSDICDERSCKRKDKFESRYYHQPRLFNGCTTTTNLQKNFQCLSLGSRPPAPPPRPAKPISRYAGSEDCRTEIPQYSVARKPAAPSFEEARRLMEYVQPDSNNYNGNDGSIRKASLHRKDISFFEDPNANYDSPPPPRPNCCCSDPKPIPSSNRDVPQSRAFTPTNLSQDPQMDYDLVPPPLPLSAPPRKASFDESYDIPNPTALCRINSVSADYDCPRLAMVDNNDTCTCHVAALMKSTKDRLSAQNRKNSLPTVPSLDFLETSNDSWNKLQQQNNVCLRPRKDNDDDNRDSIPEEMAPPPPIGENESPEDHYKIVGVPVPISSSFIKIS